MLPSEEPVVVRLYSVRVNKKTTDQVRPDARGARHRSTALPQLSAHAPTDPPLSHAICKYIERPPGSIRIRTRKHCTAHQHMRQHHRIAHTFTSTNSRLSPSILAVSPPAGAALTHRASPRAPFASASPSDQHEAQRPACHRPWLPRSLVLPFHPKRLCGGNAVGPFGVADEQTCPS